LGQRQQKREDQRELADFRRHGLCAPLRSATRGSAFGERSEMLE
jgi:hypothetical protein